MTGYRPTYIRRHPARFRRLLVGVLGTTALTLSACAQGEPMNSTSATLDRQSSAAQAPTPDAVVAQEGQAETTPTEGAVSTIRREVVYTAEVSLEVEDVGTTAARLRTAVIKDGGFLLNDDRVEGSATLVLKVQPKEFEDTIGSLEQLGKVRSRRINAQDVTAEMVDLEARLNSAKVSRDRLRTLLNAAVKVEDIVAIEAELSTREATVEQLQGQINVLRNQVGFATITVQLYERSVAAIDDSKTTPSEALQNGWVALVDFLRSVVVVGATILPFIPFGIAAWLLFRVIRKKRKAYWHARGGRPASTATWTPAQPATQHATQTTTQATTRETAQETTPPAAQHPSTPSQEPLEPPTSQ
jgi:hypothetical protein